MPDVSIINVNNTDYSIKDTIARTAAQSATATASAAQSYAESIDITITYNSGTETITFVKGAE